MQDYQQEHPYLSLSIEIGGTLIAILIIGYVISTY